MLPLYLRSKAHHILPHATRSVHIVSKLGFGADNTERYEKTRPSYPESSIQYICSLLRANQIENTLKSHRILELGAGTGKFTSSFFKHENLSAAEFNMCPLKSFEYISTEPSPEFLAKLRQLEDTFFRPNNRLSWKFTTQQASASALPFQPTSEGPITGVLAAQCFHWMATKETLMELSRVCKPGAPLVLVWNMFNVKRAWLNVLENDIISKVYDELNSTLGAGNQVPRYATGAWKEVFAGQPITFHYDLQRVPGCSLEVVVERVLSISVMQQLSEDGRREVSEKVARLLRTHPDTRDLSQYELEYEVCVASTAIGRSNN